VPGGAGLGYGYGKQCDLLGYPGSKKRGLPGWGALCQALCGALAAHLLWGAWLGALGLGLTGAE